MMSLTLRPSNLRLQQQETWRKTASANVVLFIQDTSELDYTQHRSVKGLGHIGDGRGQGIMLHSCLAVIPTPGNPQVLGQAGQIPWMRSNDNHDLNAEIVPELLRTQSEGEIWAEMVEFIGKAPAPETDLIRVSVGDRGSDIFSYVRRAKALSVAMSTTSHPKPLMFSVFSRPIYESVL